MSTRELAEAAGISEAEAEELIAAAIAAPVAPPPNWRARLLAAVAPAWGAFVSAFAAQIDLPVEKARELLDRAERAAAWVAGPLPGVSVFHLPSGPACSGADVGLVRLGAGVVFPPHRHLGPERVLVLDGSYIDDRGREFRPGDRDERDEGEPHHFVAGANGVVFVVVLREGIAIPTPDGGEIVVRG
ncbi:MAG: cupin domain-containing protein [Deltaproteobacteria bacterium]|nr:cupin domain-containing protein [Deltaproteobacteria bacterium]